MSWVVLNRYFQDELTYLRESGRLFARKNPKLVNYLSDRSTDPDVERMLEAFAFLTSRLREKLDDELPELYQSVTSLLWPNAMRPFPPTTLMRFTPVDRAITTRQVLQKDTVLLSQPVDGTICEFKTTAPCTIYPLDIQSTSVSRSQNKSSLKVELETLSGLPLSKLSLKNLRFWFCGEAHVAQALYLHCCRYLTQIRITTNGDEREFTVPVSDLTPGGLSFSESLLPNDSEAFFGYQLLQEYFVFPQKFLCLDLNNLDRVLGDAQSDGFTIEFDFERTFPADVRVRRDDVQLYCAPAVNLFSHDAEPTLISHSKLHYLLRPANANREAHEIFSVDKVASWKGGGEKDKGSNLNIYPRFETFDHEVEREKGLNQIYYRLKLRPSVANSGLDHLVSFIRHDEHFIVPRDESLSAELTCFNGKLAQELGAGSINTMTEETPSFAKFTNLTSPTAPLYPPVDGRIYWNMISNLSLNYMSLLSKDALAAVISIYDLRAMSDRQAERAAQRRIEGIQSVETEPYDRLFKGQSVRGLRSEILLSENSFESEGDMYLFASVLAEFFRLYCSLNSFHELNVKGAETGEVYKWAPKLGQQPLI